MYQDEELRDLVLRAQCDDREAFGALYERTKDGVIGLLIRKGFQKQDAEDICEKVFLTVWLRLDQLKDALAFRKWLRVISVRTASNERRDRRPFFELLDGLAHSRSSEETDRMERVEWVRAGIMKLSQGDKEALSAFYVLGMSHVQMASKFSIPVGTVKSRLHKARKRLGKLLLEQGVGVGGNNH